MMSSEKAIRLNQVAPFEHALRYLSAFRLIAIPLFFIMMAAVYTLVYTTGGIKYVYAHSMYLVILLAGFVLGAKGGVGIGLLAGLVLGPFMPVDTQNGEPQQAVNWLYRTGFFVAAGFLCGAGSDFAKKYMAYSQWFMRHDSETGLANRISLLENLSRIEEGHYLHRGALAVVSLDNGTEVEDVYGLGVMDALIAQLANRLAGQLGRGVSLYRIKNHQLAILLAYPPEQNVELLLTGLINEFGHPFVFGDIAIHGDVRMGFSELTRLEEAPEHYLFKAEDALRVATEKSQRWVQFTPAMDRGGGRENLELLGELKSAVLSGQLSLHYQPKISLATGQIKGVEALMRWRHPVRGDIPPSKFIPRAEQSTLIDLLTEWAIDTALAQAACWSKQGIDLNMAVNISTRNLLQPDFSDTVLNLLEKHQVPASRLELEITEASFMLDVERTISELSHLTDKGVDISIDDFGTGYSSLQYLSDLPASKIKIDQSFIKTLSSTSRSSHIVRAAVNLSHDLGKLVIAEGVEDREAFEFLTSIGCDIAQGYLISRPLPAKEFTDWYLSREGRYCPGDVELSIH